MHSVSHSELAPDGGFPRQRISEYGEVIVPPPSYKNMYSELSALPATEQNFHLQNSRVKARHYRFRQADAEDVARFKRMTRIMRDRGLRIGPEMKAALRREEAQLSGHDNGLGFLNWFTNWFMGRQPGYRIQRQPQARVMPMYGGRQAGRMWSQIDF